MTIDIKQKLNERGISIKGVIQLGSHWAEEIPEFEALGAKKMVLIEPIKESFDEICRKVAGRTDVLTFNVAVGNEVGIKTMFVEKVNQSQSCSLLKPKQHLEQYPQIPFDYFEDVNCTKLDLIPFDRNDYDLIFADLQGFEGEAMRGAIETLPYIKAIFTEVNRAELYENCTMVEDLDIILSPFGFKRVETVWVGDTWGDALYIK